MIKEDYVSFETAKLLKVKGFDEDCISVYHDGELQLVSSLGVFCGEGYGEQILTYTNSECNWSPIMITAPTLQMARKWLREKHNLHIEVRSMSDLFNIIKYYWVMTNTETVRWCGESTANTVKSFDKSEEAEEDAIRHALEKLN